MKSTVNDLDKVNIKEDNKDVQLLKDKLWQ